jgi:membrane associated rhomboid family serine protease
MLILLIIVTGFVSFSAFSNRQLFDKLSFRPYAVAHQKEYYRLLSHALVHADWAHLIINMYVLYMFGEVSLQYFHITFGSQPFAKFMLLYVTSVLVSSAYGLYKHHNNPYYSAIGASGGVMAVVFTSIFFDPWAKLWFFGVIPIPGILFGILYLAYSLYMGKKNVDNVGHDAHISGALYGLVFPILLEPRLLNGFISKLLSF